MKVLFIVCDGMGDRPVAELGNKTPLEAAKKPNINRLTKEGICGLMNTIDVGIRPGSDTSHLSLFGYDPKVYYHGRGPIEAIGLNMELKHGDVALRANFASVDKDTIIKDRRAGRIESVEEFAKAVDGIKIGNIQFFVKAGTGHRAGIVLRGKGLSHMISNSDPKKEGVKPSLVTPLDNSKEAKITADALNKFLLQSHEILCIHSANKKRAKDGKPEANYILTRGSGFMVQAPTFEEKYGLKACCISGAGLYKGIGRYIGMDVLEVKGATGMPDTDLNAKMNTAKKALEKYDFVFVHMKGTDVMGEDGNPKGKKEFIEKIDRSLSTIYGIEDVLTVITSDHSTPCSLKNHSGDSVPLLIHGKGVRTDSISEFGERNCANGGIGRIKGLDLMNEIINLIGRAKLYGA